jgi:hypothetical protein
MTPGSYWMAASLTAAAILAWSVERPALSFQRSLTTEPDWRSAFDLVERNIGRDDLVSAPGANDAVEFYGRELQRRISKRDRLAMAFSWTARTDFSWLIAGAGLRFDPNWPETIEHLRQRFLVDLSPTADPTVFFIGKELHPTYLLACNFELPAETIARSSLLRDCLRQEGAEEGALRQLHVLLANKSVSLANPTLLESVGLLKDAGQLDDARALANAIVLREPQWADARGALEIVGGANSTTKSESESKPTPQSGKSAP